MATPPKSEIRKEQILRAAEKIFAHKGFYDATISDVAREAKVSDATIYEYFSSKEELLFSIPGEATRRYKEETEFILDFIRSAADKIRCVIHRYLWIYQNNPDYASVTMLILKQSRKFLEMPAYQDVQELTRLILNIINEGIATGEFKSDLNPLLVRAVILGTIEHLVIRRALLGKPENLIEVSDQLANLIINGIISLKEERAWNFRITLDPEETAPKRNPFPVRKKLTGDKTAVQKSLPEEISS